MDFRTINYFLHLARYQHVSATADVLHISQPSLSKQIRALEKELGVKLFDRVGNRIVLNQSGEEFARHAARAMDLLAMGVNAAKSNRYETTGSVHIVYATYAPLLSRCCADYARLNPNVTFQSLGVETAVQRNLIDRMDFMLKAAPVQEFPPHTEKADQFWVPQTLFREHYVLVYGPTVEQMLGRSPSSLFDLRDVNFVTMYPKGVFFSDITYPLCLNAGFFPKVYHETDEYIVKVKLVQEGLAVAFLPQVCLPDATALAPDLRWMEVEDPIAERDIILMRRKRALMTETALDFWDFVLDYYQLPPDERK